MQIPNVILDQWGVTPGDSLSLWVDEDYHLVLAPLDTMQGLEFTADTVVLDKRKNIALPILIKALYHLDKQKKCFIYYYPDDGFCQIKINCYLANTNVVPFSLIAAKYVQESKSQYNIYHKKIN